MTTYVQQDDIDEYTDAHRRFWVSLFLTTSLVLIAAGRLIPGHPLESRISPQLLNWLEFFLALPVVLWAGWPVFARAWQSILNWSFNLGMGVGFGVGIAYIYCIMALVFPTRFPYMVQLKDGRAPVYFEVVAVSITLILLGWLLDLKDRNEAKAVTNLLQSIMPRTAHRVNDDGTEVELPIDLIQTGDRLRVRPGEKIPVDGIVIEGFGIVDNSMVGGGAIPESIQKSSSVIGSSVIRKGTVLIEAVDVGEDTFVSQFIRTAVNT